MIPLSVPNLNGNEIEYVKKAIETEWVSTAGSFISDFEDAICKYTKAKYAVACQSGTAGLHLAMLSLGIGKDDIVLAPTLTFIAAINPITYVGASPIFFDCDDSLTIDTNKLEEYLLNECEFDGEKTIEKESKKRISAIVAVHVFGNMCDMEALMEISHKYKIAIIEDATEALGSYYTEGKYQGRYAGTIGDVGVYSFNGNKIITTGGGGMIVTNDRDKAEYCRHLSTQAKSDALYFVHDMIGYNYRMTNLQAALGLAQLEQLETFVEIKKNNYNLYLSQGVKLLPYRKDIRSNYWFYSYMTNDRDGLMVYLSDKDIISRPVWKLIHELDLYMHHRAYRVNKAKEYQSMVLNIPCSSNLSENEVKLVSKFILSYGEGTSHGRA